MSACTALLIPGAAESIAVPCNTAYVCTSDSGEWHNGVRAHMTNPGGQDSAPSLVLGMCVGG